jgi:hypothetical protein
MGFVDVLIGAMAAVVLLFMAQAARPPVKPGFGVGGPTLHVVLDKKETGDPQPGLALRYRLPRNASNALAASELGKNAEKRLFALSSKDGADTHVIQFAEKAVFQDDELLLLYLHDLRGRAWDAPPAIVRVTLTSGGKETSWPRLELTADKPLLLKKLNTLSGQRGGNVVEWERP